MASSSEGFGQGCGCVFGVLFAVALILFGLFGVSKVTSPCPTCHTSGDCGVCRGTGKGMLFGDCLACKGGKRCLTCGGSGWKSK